MNTAETILVIILGSALAVSLVLAIIALVLIIKILRRVKRVSEQAASITSKAEHVVSLFERSAPTIAVARLVTSISEMFSKDTKRGWRRKR